MTQSKRPNDEDARRDEQPDDDAEQQSANDPIDDLEELRLSQDFGDATNVRPVLTMVPYRKPNRHEFIRIRSGDDWRFQTPIFIDKVTDEEYLVSKDLWQELVSELKPTILVLAVTRNSNIPFVWPLRIPDSERPNSWHVSAIAAAKEAESSWVRVVSDTTAKMYVPHVACGSLDEPIWPEVGLQDLIRLAFNNRFIDSPDHAILRRLRGEI